MEKLVPVDDAGVLVAGRERAGTVNLRAGKSQ